jgi:N4-(beta-N-acetylglucosaminyl)-L-asparaginase
MSDLTRRNFLQAATAAAGVGLLPAAALGAQAAANKANGPVVIASGNGLRATEKAAEILRQRGDTLDAVIAGVNIIEEDPADHTVGYGGLPNEDGVVELDSSVMHGPTCRAGAVAALRNIKTPSRVAKLVMERTDHVMLVGEGALRFARAHGFEEVNLLTDDARKIWLRWKERHSDIDDWLSPPGELEDIDLESNAQSMADIPLTYGTINCCAVDGAGNVSGVTTTSGLSFKIPGRVGDSPIIGAGLYVDNHVGAAGATGRGEAVIKICGAHTIVEAMRTGMSPLEACRYALERIIETTTEPHLLREDGHPKFDVVFYAVAKDGRYGSASMWSGAKFAVFANGKNRIEPCSFRFEREEVE